MNKKKILFISGIIILLIIAIILMFILIKPRNNSSLEEVENAFIDIGSKYYKNTYYKGLGTDKNAIDIFLDKYRDSGIPVDLENLKRTGNGIYKSDIENLLNEKNLTCDDKKTKIIIYPKDPYEIDDFEIKINLECE